MDEGTIMELKMNAYKHDNILLSISYIHLLLLLLSCLVHQLLFKIAYNF